MKIKTTILLLAVVCFARGALGQGTMQFTFDGPPVVAPGTRVSVGSYYEAGMSFRPLPQVLTFDRVGAPTDLSLPDNGTAFVQVGSGEALMFSFTDGSPFSLVSVDLAGYSSDAPDATIQFWGFHADGSIATTNVGRHGITFETYFFGPDFSDLTRVEIPTHDWSLDNLVVSVPEPSALSLCLLGLACGFAKLRKLPH
jgi:hypothetical protein